jgi:WD40 repeat protein
LRERAVEKGEKGLTVLSGERVDALAFSPGGRLLAAAHGDGGNMIHIWDIETGEIALERRPLHAGVVRCLAFGHDGKILACGGDAVEVWRLDGGTDRTLPLPPGSHASALALAPDGTLAVGLDQGSSGGKVFLQLWDPRSAREVAGRGEHSGRVTALAFGPAGRVLVSGSSDGTVRLWGHSLSGKPRVLQVGAPVTGLALPPAGKQLVVVVWQGGPRGVQFWDRDNAQLELEDCKPTSGRTHGVAYALDGTLLAVADGSSLVVCDPRTRRLLGAVSGHGKDFLALALSPDGLAATAGADRTLRLWDLRRLAPR